MSLSLLESSEASLARRSADRLDGSLGHRPTLSEARKKPRDHRLPIAVSAMVESSEAQGSIPSIGWSGGVSHSLSL